MYKVLIVDDEELERKVLAFTLRNSNLPLEIIGEAGSGRDALLQVQAMPPDLVIMDIKMPGMDGIEATKQIKMLDPTIEVIMLTAYGKFSYSQQAIKAQASDYLLKPIQPQQLIQAVAAAFERLALKSFQPGPARNLTKIMEQVRLLNLREARRELDLLLDDVAREHSEIQKTFLHALGWRILVIVEQAALSAGADPLEFTAVEKEQGQALTQVASLQDFRGWGDALLDQCEGLLGTCSEKVDLALVRKAMVYIESHYAEDISLASVAAHVHLSPTYLSRIFSKKAGTRFSDFVIRVRLQAAKQRLSGSGETIEQIANTTGFRSGSYLTYVFKKHEGLTPSEYRAGFLAQDVNMQAQCDSDYGH